MDQVIGGWQMSAIATAQNGAAIVTQSWDSGGMGAGFPHSDRLHCVAGVSPVADNPTPDRSFVREAFRNAAAGEYGNCSRNNLIGPSTWNVDFSTMKDFRLAENHNLQFRMEMFNAPNHPAWGSPSANWGSQGANAAVSFGCIRLTSQLRQIQFARSLPGGRSITADSAGWDERLPDLGVAREKFADHVDRGEESDGKDSRRKPAAAAVPKSLKTGPTVSRPRTS